MLEQINFYFKVYFWEIFKLTLLIINIIVIVLLGYFLIELRKQNEKINTIEKRNEKFLESIEKYVEIFNEQNVKSLLNEEQISNENSASKKIASIRNEYRKKLLSKNNTLTDEHEMLIDFVTLSLSLLIRIPKTYRLKLIDETTDNEMIKKILISKLPSISEHYIPISILEVAISKEN